MPGGQPRRRRLLQQTYPAAGLVCGSAESTRNDRPS